MTTPEDDQAECLTELANPRGFYGINPGLLRASYVAQEPSLWLVVLNTRIFGGHPYSLPCEIGYCVERAGRIVSRGVTH